MGDNITHWEIVRMDTKEQAKKKAEAKVLELVKSGEKVALSEGPGKFAVSYEAAAGFFTGHVITGAFPFKPEVKCPPVGTMCYVWDGAERPDQPYVCYYTGNENSDYMWSDSPSVDSRGFCNPFDHFEPVETGDSAKRLLKEAYRVLGNRPGGEGGPKVLRLYSNICAYLECNGGL